MSDGSCADSQSTRSASLFGLQLGTTSCLLAARLAALQPLHTRDRLWRVCCVAWWRIAVTSSTGRPWGRAAAGFEVVFDLCGAHTHSLCTW